MGIFEIMLFLLNGIFFVVLLNKVYLEHPRVKMLPIITFGVLIVHMMNELVRWQLYPLYFVTGMLFAIELNNQFLAQKFNEAKHLYRKRKVVMFVIALAIALSFVATFAFQLESLPLPTGKELIGTSTFDLVDSNRIEFYSEKKDQPRKIKVQIWYPSDDIGSSNPVLWLEDGQIVARALAQEMKLPFFVLDHTAKILSHSYKDASISDKMSTYPVIILSHGWTGFRNIHTDLAENLASHGYIVIGIDHTYGSQITVFENGDVAYLNQGALPSRDETPNFLEYANRLVTTYSEDVEFVINQLNDFNGGAIGENLSGRFDVDNIGLLGHSTSGGGDVLAALYDNRIKALLGMDAWVEPIHETDINKGLKIPALFLRSGQWETGFNNANLLNLINKSSNDINLYQINKTTHVDFTMAYMYTRLTKFVKLTGDVERAKYYEIQNGFIINFFDKTLKMNSKIIMDQVAENWNEVTKIK